MAKEITGLRNRIYTYTCNSLESARYFFQINAEDNGNHHLDQVDEWLVVLRAELQALKKKYSK